MMGCFSCLFPRRKEISSSRIEDSNVAGSDAQFVVPNSPAAGADKMKNPQVHEDRSNNCAKSFYFRELAAATRNFKEANLIGEGGFGRVYKGRLESGEVVAIKQLNREGVQGSKEFLVEVLMLSMLRHSNLVNLYGYCAEGDERLLVYEYMPKGSLEDHLFDLRPDRQPLEWNTRVKIALGAAKGLTYLHDAANPPVIYRDMKAANILLDDDFNPKLSDFGLAKLGPVGDKTHVSTRVMGTYGYCAPDYAMSGKLTMKSDVYSFGVLLLEVLSGRRAFDSSKMGAEQNLMTWRSSPYNSPIFQLEVNSGLGISKVCPSTIQTVVRSSQCYIAIMSASGKSTKVETTGFSRIGLFLLRKEEKKDHRIKIQHISLLKQIVYVQNLISEASSTQQEIETFKSSEKHLSSY